MKVLKTAANFLFVLAYIANVGSLLGNAFMWLFFSQPFLSYDGSAYSNLEVKREWITGLTFIVIGLTNGMTLFPKTTSSEQPAQSVE